MIETREDFAQINATLADTVPDEHEELLDLIEALREVVRGAKDAQRSLIALGLPPHNLLRERLIALPDWITE